MTTALMPLADVSKMADAMAKSGLFGVKTPDQALALMLVAQAEGVHPATIAQDYDIIQGRAARKTHSVLARFQQAGGKVEWHALTDTEADATFSHPQGTARIKWTIDQAKRIGLTGKDNWKNYPRAMLRARVIAEGVRAAYPAAIGGMLVTEELQDLPPQNVKEMGAAVVEAPTDEAYLAFEAEHLATLRSAAMGGMASLQTSFAAIPQSSHKAALWKAHSASLKAAAATVDSAGTMIENEAAQ